MFIPPNPAGESMKVRVPYVVFETKTGKYGIDAYFFVRLEKVERRATLIKRADELTAVESPPPGLILTKEALEGHLLSLFLTLYELSGERFRRRAWHMRRWSLWRLIGIPTGHQRHIDIDERLAKENREAMLALAILRKVLGIKGPEEIERAFVRPIGYAFLELEVNGSEVSDPVYRELFRIDPHAGMALPWLKMKEKGQ